MDIGQIAGMKGIIYILKSQANERYYIGSTNDLDRRLIEHQMGKTKYTKSAGPFELVFKQGFESVELARKIEYRFKKSKSRKIIEAILKEGIIRMGP